MTYVSLVLSEAYTFLQEARRNASIPFLATITNWGGTARRSLGRRLRLRLFMQTSCSVLLSHLADVPWSVSVTLRARRWVSRCLRALTGQVRPGGSGEQFMAATRRARVIAARSGYLDIVTALARRVFDTHVLQPRPPSPVRA